jgi:N-formylglutamate deformylase
VTLPPWVVLHMPHVSTEVPKDVRGQFLLDDDELAAEIDLLTDHHVPHLFLDEASPPPTLRAEVSRVVVDFERFVDDEREPASRHGFGAIYTKTTTGKPLRRPLEPAERAALLERHELHHRMLTDAVRSALDHYGRCLVLDCHSFPDEPLPFELASPDGSRPDICIGADPVHTPPELTTAFVSAFAEQGWSVAVNHPFAGAVVPAAFYASEPRVLAIMVDVNRRICRDEDGPVRGSDHPICKLVRACCERAIAAFLDSRVQESIDAGENSARPPGRVSTFEVSEYGTLTPEGFDEPETRRDAYEDRIHGWSESPKSLAREIACFEPLAWAVHPLYADAREELEYEIEQLQEALDEEADDEGAAELRKELAEHHARLENMPEEPYDGAGDWLETLDAATFEQQVVPKIERWLDEGPDSGEEEYFGRAGGQEDALRFFRDMDPDDLDTLGVVIIEGEHPGSSYYAAELRCDVQAANEAASAAGIPVRFVDGG